MIGRLEYFVKEKGMKFSTSWKNRNKTIITQLTLSSKCKTKTEIGIGSTYKEVINNSYNFGEVFAYNLARRNKESVSILSYNKMRFTFDGNNKEFSRVVKISCHDPYYKPTTKKE